MKKNLIVVSVDALVFEDIEYAKALPSFAKILNNGSRINKVKTIYPSLTHPVHATMMSGNPAGVTGIVSNEEFTFGDKERPWYNELSQMKCETIFHAAHRAGLTTAACRWPVTANGGDVIDYLVPEIMEADMRGHEHEPLTVYKKLGSQDCLDGILTAALEKFGFSGEHPVYDDFQIYCACEIIKKFKPNVLFTHPGDVDSVRHRYGVFSEQVKDALQRTDKWLGMLLDAISEAGMQESTDIVVLSDHGQINVKRVCAPNVYLAEKGFIKLDKNGKIQSFDAYSSSGALNCLITLSNPDDQSLKSDVYKAFTEMADAEIYGVERVFTADEVKEKYGLFGDFDFVIETDGCTAFVDDINVPVMRDLDISQNPCGFGKHGHLPEKGAQPTFMACGPSFKQGIIIENGCILNHAPTFARALGIELPMAQGRAVDELFN